MFVIKGIVMLAALAIGGEAVAHGTLTLTEQRGILSKGLAEAIAHKFAYPESLEELKQLILRQKSEYLLHTSEKIFERQLEEHIRYLQRNKDAFEPLMEESDLLDGEEASYQHTEDDDYYFQQAWEEIMAELDKVEKMAAIENTEARRQEIADYLAADKTQRTMDAFSDYFPPIRENEASANFPTLEHFGNAIKEAYLNLLHYQELESLAHALGQGELVLAAETPIDRMAREVKTKEEINKLSNVLTGIAAQKQAAEH